MQIVIDISEEGYKRIIDGRWIGNPLADYIEDGMPLPKGHGRLIDADKLKTSKTWTLVAENNASQNEISFAPLVCILKEDIDNAMTIIEADKEAEDD